MSKSDFKIGTEIIKKANGRLSVLLHTGPDSVVQQSAKDECDVNKIMERFQNTGQLPSMIKNNPQYGDFSSPTDFQESLNLVIHAQEQFDGLPAKTRAKFENDPAKFLEFASNKENIEEMATLGLLNDKAMEALKNAKLAKKNADRERIYEEESAKRSSKKPQEAPESRKS